MADKLKFINDLRAAITSTVDTIEHMTTLAEFYTALEWTPEDFTEVLAGSDITPAGSGGRD